MRAEEFIQQTQHLLGDPAGDFHTKAKVLTSLTMALEDICTRSRTLCDWHFEPALAEQGRYGLPESYLATKYVGFFYEGVLYDLHPGNTGDTAPAVFSTTPQNTRVPQTYADGGNAYIEKTVATVTNVIEHSTVYPGVGVGDVQIDSEIPQVKVGDRFINMTDNSEGVVSDLEVASGSIVYADLKDGKTNITQIGDEIRILSRTAHRHTLTIAPPPAETDPFGTESIYIYLARTHRSITETDIEADNDDIELGTEFHSALRHRVMYYASLEEKGISHPDTIAFDVKYETDYHKAFPRANRRIQAYLTAWRQQARRVRPRKTFIQAADWSVRAPYIL